MAFTPDTITTLDNSSTATLLNENFDRISEEFEEVIYRDGSADMNSNLNMDSHRIINLADGIANTDAVTVRQLEDVSQGEKGDPGSNVMAIGLFADADGLTIPVGTDAVFTSGHSTVGYGAARYVASGVVDAAFVTAHPALAFITVNNRGFILDENQRITDGMIGCLPDCDQDDYTGTDIAPLLEDFWDAFEFHVDFTLIACTPPIYFGDGDFKLGSELEPRRIIRVIGTCSGHNNFLGGTRWHSPVDTRALTINIQLSGGGTKLGANAGTAEGSLIQGIQFIPQGGTSTSAHAIWLRGRATLIDNVIGELRNADLTKGTWAGNGIHIVANSGGAGADYGNANNSRLHNNYVERCAGHGLYISGTDANAILNTGFETRLCGGCGILDASGLGNTHVGYNIAGFANNSPLKGRVNHAGRSYQLISNTANIGGATTPGTDNNIWYDMGATAVNPAWPAWVSLAAYSPDIPVLCVGTSNRSVFSGSYSEGGTCHIQAPAIALGGQAGYSSQSSALQQNQIGNVTALMCPTGVGGSQSYLTGQPGYSFAGSVIWTIVGGNDSTVANTRTILQHKRAAASNLEMIWGWSSEDMICRFVGQANYFRMTGPLTTQQFGTGAAVPYKFCLTDPVFIDSTDITKSRKVGMRDTIPVSGTHAQGDRFYDSAPVAGGTEGWVCVTAGTPGTWKTFGAIAA